MSRLTELYAFVFDAGGQDVIATVSIGGASVEAVVGTIEGVHLLAPHVQRVADQNGASFRVLKFDHLTDVTEILR